MVRRKEDLESDENESEEESVELESVEDNSDEDNESGEDESENSEDEDEDDLEEDYEKMQSNMKNFTKLALLPSQLEPFEKAVGLLETDMCYIDTSETGRGKTFLTAALASEFRLPMAIFGPKGVLMPWTRDTRKVVKTKTNGIIKQEVSPVVANRIPAVFIPYTMVAGRAGKGVSKKSMKPGQSVKIYPAHGLLVRVDTKSIPKKKGAEGKVSSKFYPTKNLISLIEAGTLFVYDEFHRLKNASAQSNACVAISKAIARIGGKSRLVMLSASPITHVENYSRLLQLSGIMTKTKYTSNTAEGVSYKNQGAGEVIEYAKKFDPVTTKKLVTVLDKQIRGQDVKGAGAIIRKDFIPKIYSEVIKKYISGEIINNDIGKANIFNAFFPIDSENAEELSKLITDLAETLNFDFNTMMFGEGVGIQGYTRALKGIETLSRDIYIREAKKVLEADKHSTVVIFLNFVDNVLHVHRELQAYVNKKPKKQRYEVLKILGDKEEMDDAKDEVIDKFQLGESRVLVISAKSVAEGVNLHDTTIGGKMVRNVFISPSYHYITIYQQIGRFLRVGSTSEPNIYMVYAKTDASVLEIRMRESVPNKDKYMGGALAEGGKGRRLPSTYDVLVALDKKEIKLAEDQGITLWKSRFRIEDASFLKKEKLGFGFGIPEDIISKVRSKVVSRVPSGRPKAAAKAKGKAKGRGRPKGSGKKKVSSSDEVSSMTSDTESVESDSEESEESEKVVKKPKARGRPKGRPKGSKNKKKVESSEESLDESSSDQERSDISDISD